MREKKKKRRRRRGVQINKKQAFYRSLSLSLLNAQRVRFRETTKAQSRGIKSSVYSKIVFVAAVCDEKFLDFDTLHKKDAALSKEMQMRAAMTSLSLRDELSRASK